MKTRPAKKIGKYIPVWLPLGFDGTTKRKVRYCKTRGDADKLVAAINRWKANKDAPIDTTIRIDEMALKWVSYLQTEIGDLTKLPKILAHWRATGANVVETSITDAISKYLAWRTSGSVATKTDVRSRLNQFGGAFSGRSVSSITHTEISAYIDTYKSLANKERHFIRVSQFIDWCVTQGLASMNPMDKLLAPKPEAHEAQIYKVDDIAKILNATDEHAPENLAAFICELYGFVRIQEIKKLQWDDINFREEDGYIHVRREIAKGNRERYIPLCGVLRHWLTPLRKESGNVAPKNYDHKTVVELAGVKYSNNAFRHSAISYTISAQDPEAGIRQVNLWSGHSESTCRGAYLKSVDPQEAKRFLALRRAA
jgi:integrase